MITLDARGLSCPEPLLMATEAVRNNPKEVVQITVSTQNAKENIERMAPRYGRTVDVRVVRPDYVITLKLN